MKKLTKRRTMDFVWAQCLSLRAEGDKMMAEGRKMVAEGRKLLAEAVRKSKPTERGNETKNIEAFRNICKFYAGRKCYQGRKRKRCYCTRCPLMKTKGGA